MKIMAALLVVLLITFGSVAAYAYGEWQSATNTGQEKTGDMFLTKCLYKTLGGYEFYIIVRGLCPFSVQVNPESGQVKK